MSRKRQHSHRLVRPENKNYLRRVRLRSRTVPVVWSITTPKDYSAPDIASASVVDSDNRTLRVEYAVPQRRTPEKIFRELLQKWRKETWFVSSMKKRVSHPAYLNIIGMGPAGIPLILQELQHTPDHWFWALQAITRKDPAPPNATFDQMRDAWLAWGKHNGYLR